MYLVWIKGQRGPIAQRISDDALTNTHNGKVKGEYIQHDKIKEGEEHLGLNSLALLYPYVEPSK